MKLKFFAIIFPCFLSFTISAVAQIYKLIDQLHNPFDKQVLVAAHRGDWRNAPENSLDAYRFAIESGVDIVEVDLKMSKDSVLIILHDQTLDRSTNGTGKPSSYSLAELKLLKLRDGLGVPTNLTIPTLEEVMLLAKGKAMINLDHSAPFYKEAFRILKKTGTLDQAIFKSDEPYAKLFGRYGKLLDSINFMPVIEADYGGTNKMIEEYQKNMKPVAVELVFSKDTAGIFKNNAVIKARGSKVWVNTLWPNLCGGHHDDLAVLYGKPEESWGWLIDHGVNIIQTDRPKELVEYLRKRGLHK